jgi:hypothetical protein
MIKVLIESAGYRGGLCTKKCRIKRKIRRKRAANASDNSYEKSNEYK